MCCFYGLDWGSPAGNLPKTQAEWEKEHPDHAWAADRDLLLPGYYDEWAAARKHPSGVVYKAVVGVTGDGTNDAPALKVWPPRTFFNWGAEETVLAGK